MRWTPIPFHIREGGEGQTKPNQKFPPPLFLLSKFLSVAFSTAKRPSHINIFPVRASAALSSFRRRCTWMHLQQVKVRGHRKAKHQAESITAHRGLVKVLIDSC